MPPTRTMSHICEGRDPGCRGRRSINDGTHLHGTCARGFYQRKASHSRGSRKYSVHPANESLRAWSSRMPPCRTFAFCYPEGCAAPSCVRCQCDTRESLSKLERTSPQRKIDVTSKPPVGGISVVTLIRTDTTLDHSQKAEKVWCTCMRCPIVIVVAEDSAALELPQPYPLVAFFGCVRASALTSAFWLTHASFEG